MVNVTEVAQQEIVKLMDKQKNQVVGVRVKAEAVSPLRANFRLAFVQQDQVSDDDRVLEHEGIQHLRRQGE